MATLTLGNSGNGQNNTPFGFTISNLNYLSFSTQTPTLAQGNYRRLGASNIVDTFKGVGFTFDQNGIPTGGTITEYNETVNGALVAKLEGAALPVTSLVAWARTNDSTTAANTIFSGNDTIIGTAGNDVLQGYGGDNLVFGSGSVDTAVFSGLQSSYSFVHLDPDVLLVSDAASTTSLHDISNLRFADQTVSVAAVPLSSAVAGANTTSGLPLSVNANAYTGPVNGLFAEYINVTSDNLNLAAAVNDVFLHTGSGTDAIAVRGGTNVLDGGTGSNFLTGGSGTDTFYIDARGASASTWSTVVGFHKGDAVTVWGVSQPSLPASNILLESDNQGAAGFTGLTLLASAPNQPSASLTLSGFSQADLANGRLSITYGTDAASGSDYMHITANS